MCKQQSLDSWLIDFIFFVVHTHGMCILMLVSVISCLGVSGFSLDIDLFYSLIIECR